MDQELADLVAEMKKGPPAPCAIPKKDLLSSGSTLLNLACSGYKEGAFPRGKIIFFVGDSWSGKTFICMTCFAEAALRKLFRKYRFIYDGVEGGAIMDIEALFGKAVKERLEPPRVVDGEPDSSGNIEEFYFNLDDAVKKGVPFIYILDSMDALDSEEAAKKFSKQKKLYRRGKDMGGSYGDTKAKKNSANLRRFLKPLRELKSILIIINQTRDNIPTNPFLAKFAEKKTRSGGRALKFYATIEMWSSIKRKLVKKVGESKKRMGVECTIEVKKNRLTGKERMVDVPIYYSHGIDDTGSCVDFLITEGHWKEKKGIVAAKEFDVKYYREKLIRFIEEEDDRLNLLRETVEKVWNKIESELVVERKRRYE